MTVLDRAAPTAPRQARPAERRAEPAPDAVLLAERFLHGVFTAYVDAAEPVWRHVLRRPAESVQVLQAIACLPPLEVVLPRVPEADAVARMLRAHATSRRMMLGVSAVIRTPTLPGTYTDGADRSTLRRKVRAAARQGVTVRAVAPEDRPALVELARTHEQHNEREQYRSATPVVDDLLQYDLWLAAYDSEERPVMLAVIPRAGQWAVLRYFRTLVPGQTASDARYLMTSVLAEELATLGVRHLVDTSRPHWLPNGLRHFQRMVGFRLVRLRSIRVLRG